MNMKYTKAPHQFPSSTVTVINLQKTVWKVKLTFTFLGGDLAPLKDNWPANGDRNVKKLGKKKKKQTYQTMYDFYF